MTSYEDLRDFFSNLGYRVIIAADAEPRVTKLEKGTPVTRPPAGGVAVAFDPIAKAANAIYIGRGKSNEEKELTGSVGKFAIADSDGGYTLKRLYFDDKDFENYYYGFSNQTMWPLCHVTFEQPIFQTDWYESFVKVNKSYAQAIEEEIKGKTFIWVNDYQLSLVPSFLKKRKDTVIGMFWHIPWPTWEVFRILPQKTQILESMLQCDVVAFHRGYQARNFIKTVARELEVRTDDETNKVYYKNHVTTVVNLPMGIDVDVMRTMSETEVEETFLSKIAKNILHLDEPEATKSSHLDDFFRKNKVIIGVDRLDYTKGILLRLQAIDKFFEKNPSYLGRVAYLGIIAPSRESIPLYKDLKKRVKALAHEINVKYATREWLPIYLIYDLFSRKDIVKFYQKSDLCLVTPRDDGMNLVSKEFVLASSFSKDPGMLVLSQFAGSAIDLTESLIVNPYDIDSVAAAIKRGLEMSKKEKQERIAPMIENLEDHNVYSWAMDFIRTTIKAAK